jgi:hypothetical protein
MGTDVVTNGGIVTMPGKLNHQDSYQMDQYGIDLAYDFSMILDGFEFKDIFPA